MKKFAIFTFTPLYLDDDPSTSTGKLVDPIMDFFHHETGHI